LVEAVVSTYRVFAVLQSVILIVVWLMIGDIRRFAEVSLYELLSGRFELASKAVPNLQTVLLALLALFVVTTIRLYLTQMMGIGPAVHLLEVLSVATFNLDTAALFLGVLAASRVLLLLFPPGIHIRRSESAGEADEHLECAQQHSLEFAILIAGLSLALWGFLWLFVEPPLYSVLYVVLVAALTYHRCSRKCCRILDLALSAVPPTGFAVQLL